jgi:hypothetical protein
MQINEHIDEIKSKIQPWKSKSENSLMLVSQGYEYDKVMEAIDSYYKTDDQNKDTQIDNLNTNKKSNNYAPVFGAIFLIAAFLRFYRYSNSGNILFIIGIFTALGMAYFFFTENDDKGEGLY